MNRERFYIITNLVFEIFIVSGTVYLIEWRQWPWYSFGWAILIVLLHWISMAMIMNLSEDKSKNTEGQTLNGQHGKNQGEIRRDVSGAKIGGD